MGQVGRWTVFHGHFTADTVVSARPWALQGIPLTAKRCLGVMRCSINPYLLSPAGVCQLHGVLTAHRKGLGATALVIACAAATSVVHAGVPARHEHTASSQREVDSLNPVTVTVTRTPVPLAQALSQTIVIDRPQIEALAATSVVDVLRHYAGVDVTQAGGPGQPAAVFMRGGNSNYTVVMLDGIRVDEAVAGSVPLADISPEMIQRIEIVEGPRSALYGADAIGGVINIITRKPGPAHLGLAVSGGSYGTVSAAASMRDQGSVAGHSWGTSFSVQQQHSNGFPAIAGTDDSRSYRNRSLSGRMRVTTGPVQLELRAWDSSGASQYDDFAFGPPPTFAFEGFVPASHHFHHQILALQARGDVTSHWLTSFTLSHSRDDLDEDQQVDFFHTSRPELDWHNVITIRNRHRISFGGRVEDQRVTAVSSGVPLDAHVSQGYVYAQEEFRGSRQRVVAAVSYLHNGAFGGRFNWNFSYGYDLRTGTRLIAAAGSAFHAPTLGDLYFPYFGNPGLGPEKALNYEVALKQSLTARQDLELRLFRTDVRDLISYDAAAGKPRNIGKARMQGVQLVWHYVATAWDARADAIYQQPRDLSTNSWLTRRPRVAASLRFNQRLGRFDWGAQIYTAGARTDVGLVTGQPGMVDGGYLLVGAHAGLRLAPELRVQLHVNNLFDHHYQTVNGYNQSGVAVYAALRYSFPG